MTTVYRLVSSAFAENPLSGEGARRYGGRWNPPGFSVVYASESRALAALETFVHLSLEARSLQFMLFEIVIPGSAAVERYRGLRSVWRHQRPSSVTQEVGRGWLGSGKTLTLAVPSVLVPQETNFLLNAEHPHFRRVRVSRPEPFAFDERLWKS